MFFAASCDVRMAWQTKNIGGKKQKK